MHSNTDPAALRRSVYHLIILVAVAMACGRILSAQRLYEPTLHRAPEAKVGSAWPGTRPAPMPTFSSNDRSRWATVAALVDSPEPTFVVGERSLKVLYGSAVAPLGFTHPAQAAALFDAGYHARVRSDSGIIFEDGYQSVDKILDPGTMKFYSTKPPLLTVLLAGLYWLLQRLTGWTLSGEPFAVVRTILLLINAVPFAVYLWQLSRLAETWGRTDWGRLFVLAAGAFATLVGPFLISLNNHTVGTFSVMFAWLALLRIWRHKSDPSLGPPAWFHFASAGFFSAFAVTSELPALAFAAAALALLLWWFPARTLLAFAPAALIPAAGLLASNYAALGELRPAYEKFGGPWYEYEGSHWRKPAERQKKTGIDWARYHETRADYAFHVLVGHHGLFSMTPIWLLALAAMLAGCLQAPRLLGAARDEGVGPLGLPWFVLPLALALTAVVLGFYLLKSDNYGGWTNGLRWLMWLTPIWLTCLLPMADLLAPRRWGRAFALLLLGVSVLSASYQPWNPWRMPWVYELMQAFEPFGWRDYLSR